FGAFRWGYTADQPFVGIADTPLVTRDLLPLGSAATMDLLYALDDRFQEGTLDNDSVAVLARFLGATTVLLTNDIQFDRYRT
ncbi:alpha-(1-_3)-arabinofuranosyltransferase family protein, partial [Salmonella enterica subsp. enterica serovar Typhimurium]